MSVLSGLFGRSKSDDPSDGTGEDIQTDSAADGSEKFEVDLGNLRLNSVLSFSLYIKTGEDPDPRYTLYRDHQGKFDERCLKRLIEGGVKHLYVDASDRESFLDYAEQHATEVIQDPTLSFDEKGTYVYDLVANVASEILRTDLSEQQLDRCLRVSQQNARLASRGRKAIHGLVRAMARDFDAYSHAANCSILMVALCFELGIRDPEKISSLSMAAFFHDLGELDLPPELRGETFLVSEEEHRMVEEHPVRGADVLREAGSKDEVMLRAIEEHHEHFDGQGFPRRMGSEDISEGARILAVVDAFDELTTGYREPNQTTFDALRVMATKMRERFDPAVLQAFMRMMGPESAQAERVG